MCMTHMPETNAINKLHNASARQFLAPKINMAENDINKQITYNTINNF